MSTWRRVLALAAVPALGLTLAACGNSGNGTASSTTTSGAAASSTTSRSQSGSTSSTAPTSTTSIPNNVPNQDSVRKDVTLSDCSAASGGWSGGGTIRSHQSHDATYHITVFFTSAQATVLSYATTSVPVGAGGSKLWSVTAKFQAPSTVLCVLRGVAVS